MSYKANIFNTAAAIIGGPNQSSYIENPDTDSSDQAIWMRTQWEDAVDHSIIMVKPSTARMMREISETADTVEASDYDYVYDRPNDCLEVERLSEQNDRTADYEYEEMGDYILSDYDADLLVFYKKLGYDATIDYTQGLGNVIAGRLAVLVTGIWKPEYIGMATNFYNMSLDNARGTIQGSQYKVVHRLNADNQKLITDVS